MGRKSREKKDRKEQPKGAAYHDIKAKADSSQFLPNKPTFEKTISYLPEPIKVWLRNSHSRLLERSAQVLSHPQTSSLSYIVSLVKIAESMIDSFDRSNRPDVPLPACKAGCYYCCHLPVIITQLEAEAITEQVLRICTPESLSVLKSQIDSRAAARRSEPEKKLRCVFVTEEGNCGIYELRPNACISYTSFSVDDCRRTFAGENLIVPYAGIPMAVGLMLADIQMRMFGEAVGSGRRPLPSRVEDLGGEMNQILQREFEQRGIKA